MANEKISQLTAGAPAQPTDQIPIARSGSNFFLTVANLIAAISNSISFTNITNGSNTSAAMVVGSGASLTPAGSGVISATEIDGVTVSGTPAAGKAPIASSSSAASWQFILQSANGAALKIQGGIFQTSGNPYIFTFPVAFGGTPVYVIAVGDSGTVGVSIVADPPTATQFTVQASSGLWVMYIAIGPP